MYENLELVKAIVVLIADALVEECPTCKGGSRDWTTPMCETCSREGYVMTDAGSRLQWFIYGAMPKVEEK